MNFSQSNKLKIESEHSGEMWEEVHKVIKSEETITENKLALKMCYVKISKSGIPKLDVKVEHDLNDNLLITQSDINSPCPNIINHNPSPLPTTVNIKTPFTRLFLPVANSVQTCSNSDEEDPSHSVSVKPSPQAEDSRVQLCGSLPCAGASCDTSTASPTSSHAQASQLRAGTWGPAGQEGIISSEHKMKTPLQSQPVSSVSNYARVLSSQWTAESPWQDVNQSRQPSPPRKKLKQSPNFKALVPTTGPQTRPATGRMVRSGLNRAIPRNVAPSLPPSTNTNRSNKFSAARGNLIHLTSSDLPEGWKRFTVHNRERGRSMLRLAVQNSEGNIFRSQKEVDAYIKKKKLKLNVKFRNSSNTQLASHVPPQKFSPPTPKAFSPLQSPRLPASRQSLPAPLHRRSTGLLPTSLLPNNFDQQIGVFPSSPCMSDMPLPTLATALANLGQMEGKKKLVLFQLTEEQIRAFHTLGVKEVGIVG